MKFSEVLFFVLFELTRKAVILPAVYVTLAAQLSSLVRLATIPHACTLPQLYTMLIAPSGTPP